MSKVVFEVTGMRYHVESYDGERWLLLSRETALEQAIEAAKEGTGLARRVVDTWGDDND